jgi:hypothetical protein
MMWVLEKLVSSRDGRGGEGRGRTGCEGDGEENGEEGNEVKW